MAYRRKGSGGSANGRGLIFTGVFLLLLTGIFIVWYLVMQSQARASYFSRYAYASSKQGFFDPYDAPLYLAIFLGVLSVVYLIWGLLLFKKEKRVAEGLRSLTSNGVAARDFLSVRGTLRQSDFTGVYVLHNISKDMYYVGQSVKVVDRVGQHLTGHGNCDVYADYKYGDEFEVSTVSLADSGYGSLNDLERDTIAAYDAYNRGYNKTAGNSR